MTLARQLALLVVFSGLFLQTAWSASSQREFVSNQSQPAAIHQPQPGKSPSRYVQLDLSQFSARELDEYARQSYQEGNYEQAVQYQYWAIQKGHDGYYDLACNYALAGDAEAAIYWLYVDAREGSVDVDWTDQDPDLEIVREHEDWPVLREYLVEMEDYWKNSGNRANMAIVPDNYEPNTPIPLVVALHGKGGSPLTFIHEGYQSLANTLNIAIISISGPIPYGKDSYKWSTDPHFNTQHISDFLPEVLNKEKIVPSKSALFGFSQGAQASLQTVVFQPDQWQGALAMSPGLYPTSGLTFDVEFPNLREESFVITYGAQENSYYRNLSEQNIADLTAAGASLRYQEYPNQGHQFPLDYGEMISTWLKVILQMSS